MTDSGEVALFDRIAVSKMSQRSLTVACSTWWKAQSELRGRL